MNRSKSDKASGETASLSTGSAGTNVISLPFEASEDVRVLPGALRKSKTTVLSVLEPFLPLLPDISGMELSEQKLLHNCLYSAGVTAALSLQKNGVSATSALLNIDRESPEWKDLFNSLGKTLDFDDSIDTYRKLSQKLAIPEELRSDNNGQLMKMITNEVAAFALTAFASMIYRRPFTKQMEIIMAPTQETDALSTDDENALGDISRALREPSLGGLSSSGVPAAREGSTAEAPKTINPPSLARPNRAKNIPPADDYLDNTAGITPNDEQHSNASSVAAFASDDAGTECDNEDECDCQGDDEDYISECVGDEDCLFRYVCSIGYEDLAKLLVSLRQSTEFSNWNDSTPLMEACCGGYAGVVRALIEAGANVNAQSSTKNTALTYACAAQHVECVKELLKCGKCDINLRNDSGHCALMEAASVGNVEILKLLIEHGATPLSIVDNHDFKESALTLAAYKGHLDAVKYLISIFPSTVDDKNRDEEFHTALMEASMDGHVEVAKALLNAGAKTNLNNDSFESPLTLAACGGHVELADLLLSAGARLEDVNDEGYTPLMEACREGHRDVVELLINRGANINLKVDSASETPLSLAASGGYLSIVELLVQHGGDLSQGNPLCEATQEGHTDVACFIIQKLRERVSEEEILKDFNSSLMCAAELDNVIVSNTLLECNADPNCFSSDGRTPLMEAAKQGNLNIVDLLVAKNADVNAVSPNGEWTALSLACANGHADIVRYLLEHGADPRQQLSDSSSCLLEATKNGHVNCVEILLDYKVPTVSRSSARTCEKLMTRTKHNCSSSLHSNLSSNVVRPKAKGTSQKTQKADASEIPTPVAKDCGHAGGNSMEMYTDEEYTSAFAAIFQQQEQFIQQHLAHSQKSGTPSNKTAAMGGNNPLGPNTSANASQLFRALATAASSSSVYNSSDDFLFAQFIQRSLITTKKRETMSEEELNAFTEMIQQQFRTIFPSGQVDAAALMANAQLQTQSNANVSSDLNAKPCHSEEECAPRSQTQAKSKAKAPTESGVAESSQTLDNEVANYRDENQDDVGHSTKSSSSSCSFADNIKHSNNKAAAATIADTAANLRNRPRTPSPSSFSVSSRGEEPTGKCACCNASSTRLSTTNAVNDGSIAVSSNESVSASSSTSQSSHLTCDLAILDSQVDNNTDSALTVACVAGNVEIASMLIYRGFDIERRDKKGFTPLILCATGGHTDICRLLLEAGCQVDAQADRTKDTALSLACSGGRKEIVEMLLLYGANKEHRNISDYTPLSLAASGGYVEIIQLLLNHGAEINSRTGSKLGISPLMLAAMNGHEAATKLLLDNGSDINAQIETNRNTALTLACFQGRTEVVRLLIEAGANIDHRAKTGLTPLMEAANGGYVDVGAVLIEGGAEPNTAPVMTSRDTALTIAADKGHTAFVELVIHAKANVNVRNKKGCTALWLACCGGHLETVRALIKHNADADIQDNRKVSPLMIAFRKGHIAIVEFIVNYVTQFPSDQECDRYITTLTDQDLVARCSMCLKFISQAKSKQAEQANRAAQSLLEMIAQEEALAESKKRTKQRQKAKKKAKKNAKKTNQTEEDEDQNDEEQAGDSKKTDEINGVEDISTEAKVECSSLRTEEEDSQTEPKVSAEDVRVPCLDPIHEISEISSMSKLSAEKVETERLSPSTSNNHSSNGSRISSRREGVGAQKGTRRPTRRGARGGVSMLEMKSNARTMESGPKTNDETDIWVNPNKRRATTTKIAKPAVSAQQSQRPQGHTKTSSDAGMVPIDEWVADVSMLNSKRKSSHTMTVSSQSIARVIGRSGSNINAIREATNAHIEVEKMTTKREQATRLITIKGTPEAVQNSMTMINLLIKEQDLHVNDILRRVMGATATSSPPLASDSCAAAMQMDPRSVQQPIAAMVHDFSNSLKVSNQTPRNNAVKSEQISTPSMASNEHTGVTNVWQQRAAIREKQKVSDVESVDKSKSAKEFFIMSTPSVDLKQISNEETQQRPFLSQERKAPGYERPNSSSSSGATAHVMTATTVAPPLQVSVSQSHAGVTLAVSADSANSTAFVDGAGIIKKEAPNFDNLLSEDKQRSISDIWNAGDLSSPPSDLAGIFGTEILDSSTWLPSSTDLAAAGRRAANAKRYDKDSDNATGNVDWLGGMFPSLGTVVSSTMTSSSPSAFMKSILSDDPASIAAKNLQSSKVASNIAPNRWDIVNSTWNAANVNQNNKSVTSNLMDWQGEFGNATKVYGDDFPTNVPLHGADQQFGNNIRPQQQQPIMSQQPLFSTNMREAQPQANAFPGFQQFQRKFPPNMSGKDMVPAGVVQFPMSTAQQSFASSQSNPLYSQNYLPYSHPMPGQYGQHHQHLRDCSTTSTINGAAGGLGVPFHQRQFFQHQSANNGPSFNQHSMSLPPQQHGYIPKNQAAFNGNVSGGFMHPPPGFIRQAAPTTSNSFYNGHPSQLDNGSKQAPPNVSNALPAQRNYYNNFY